MKLHIIEGLEGSGKTTAITNASKFLMQEGRTVVVITDQDDTTKLAENIIYPDCIFVETAGLCSDFTTSIAKPLQLLKKELFANFTLSVFVDSQLLLSYLQEEKLPFGDEIRKTFIRQIEEADLLVINKIDLLPAEDFGLLYKLANAKFSRKKMISQNSFNPQNIQNWLSMLETLPVREKKKVQNLIQISGPDLNYLNAKKIHQNTDSLLITYQVPEQQRCCCCDECLCEKHVGDESFVCPCRTSNGGCCC